MTAVYSLIAEPDDGGLVMVMQVSTGVTGRHLDVPGGRLYYEVRGSGPLLLVVGQPMTSEPFAPTADLLAESHTVLTYDPRGLGRSSVDDPTQDVTPEIEGDDLAALIDAVGGGPADVFGTSGGAVAGLALVAGHPEHVGTLISHEPPVTELLPDAPAVRAAIDDVHNAYRDSGSGAAWAKFISLVVHSGLVPDTGVPPVSWPTPGGQEPEDEAESARKRATDEMFFLHMLKPFTRYRPRIDSLRLDVPRVVVVVGGSSGEEIARRSSVALADQIGSPAVTFPGDHGGFMADPSAFALAIERVLVPPAAPVG